MPEAVPYADHLLPNNATEFERSLAGANKRINEIPAPIELIKRPYETPADFLPFLAWERSVDLWSSRWSEPRQRAVTAASIPLHFKKGTAYALREYIRYADAQVLKIERPPMKIFSGPSLTREQRETWLSKLPQVRVWRMQEPGTAGTRKAFYGARRTGKQVSIHFFFNAGMMSTPSTALSRLHRRARWVVDEQETDVRVTELGSYFQLHLTAQAGVKVFSNRIPHQKFFVPSDAYRRLITIRPVQTSPWRTALTGSRMQAIQSEPERVKVPGVAGASVFSDRFANTGFFVPTSSPRRIFHRYPVLDGLRPARRPNVQFMNVGRYGFPAHTAYAHVSIPGKRHRRAAGEGITLPKGRFWIPHDPQPVRDVRHAAQAAKRLSDRILLNIGPRPRFVAGGPPVLADVDTVLVGQ